MRWRFAWRRCSIDTDKAFERKWFALAVAVLLHALFLNSLLRQQPRQARPDTTPSTMLWMNIVPALPKPRLLPPRPPKIAKERPASVQSAPAPIRAPAPATALIAPAADPFADTAPAPISAEQVMTFAKRDLARIDRQLRGEDGKPGGKTAFSLSGDSRQQRLAKGFEQAHDMAPNKWYQAAKIEDITPPGDDARKIYRITGALGSYCMHYPDKNRIGAQTGAANFGEPKLGKCPTMF
jgi:hypothetical protein